MPDLLLEHVAKSYPTRAEPLDILRDVNFSLDAGQNAAVLGPSGSGKSTLLYLIGALEQPTGGTLRVLGQKPAHFNAAQAAAFRRDKLGFVFQEHYLLPQCSVLENVLLPALAGVGVTPAIRERAKMLLDRVGLAARLEHRPSELSGGERQRVALARALILKPALLLADEPTGNLDQTNAVKIGKLLLELQAAEGMMLIVVTHSAELAKQFGQRFVLDDGKLVPERAAAAT